MKAVVVLSGGLDSTILLYKVVDELGADNVAALSFVYGQRHNIEIEKAKTSCTKLGVAHRIIDISFVGDVVKDVCALSDDTTVEMPTITDVLGDPQPPTYVPFRNQMLFSIACTFAESVGATEVYTGLQVHDEYGYWDTSQQFVDNFNQLIALNRMNHIELKAPFAHMSKAEEILIGQQLGVPFEDTWTCYTGEEGKGACGTCPSCAERIQNFAKVFLTDPCPYAIEIPWQELKDKELFE